jgi:hypothetical protein
MEIFVLACCGLIVVPVLTSIAVFVGLLIDSAGDIILGNREKRKKERKMKKQQKRRQKKQQRQYTWRHK